MIPIGTAARAQMLNILISEYCSLVSADACTPKAFSILYLLLGEINKRRNTACFQSDPVQGFELEWHLFLLSRDQFYFQDCQTQSVDTTYQPDDAGLIGMHIDDGHVFGLCQLIVDDRYGVFEALQPLHIDSTSYLEKVSCGSVKDWLYTVHFVCILAGETKKRTT
jgi:hypothetical protein